MQRDAIGLQIFQGFKGKMAAPKAGDAEPGARNADGAAIAAPLIEISPGDCLVQFDSQAADGVARPGRRRDEDRQGQSELDARMAGQNRAGKIDEA